MKARGDRPAILAHRGDSFRAPENTLEAARLAWQAGADAWELDVQLTRDGVPIVLHDQSLLRTTDVARRFASDPRGQNGFRVSDFDFDEVKTLDAGSWFVAKDGGPRSAHSFGTFNRLEPAWIEHYRSGRVIIPTLAEALTLTKQQDWLVNVEIKSFPEGPVGLVERVLEVVEQLEIAARVLISSFDHTDVALADRPGREHALGILTLTPLCRTHDYASDLVGADTVHVSTEILGSGTVAYRRERSSSVLRTVLVEDLKSHGIPILAYTVNDTGAGSLAEHLAQIGVDGLFTDDPQGMKRGFAAGSDSARRPDLRSGNAGSVTGGR
ncbi:MAG: glycerophosphodiester phosphodiesterase [Isosphaerales bacterium]